MKILRCWIEIVVVGTVVACMLALLIAALGVVALATERLPGQQTYEGVVTCSRCGARHSSKLGQTAGDCARTCVHGGAIFALVDGDNTYLLEGDLSALKRVAGQRTSVSGTVSGRTIRVSSVSTAR
jgi:hypothetical protein